MLLTEHVPTFFDPKIEVTRLTYDQVYFFAMAVVLAPLPPALAFLVGRCRLLLLPPPYSPSMPADPVTFIIH